MFESGGFDQSGGFMPQGSFTSPAEKTKSVNRKDNVFPVCIRQILEAPEGGLQFGDTGVHIVELVAIVRNIAVDSTNVVYLLDDNTGGLNAVYWIERSDIGQEAAPLPDVVENAYYRVYGTMRSLQGKRYIQIVRILAIKDLNELTTHILEVIHKAFTFQKELFVKSAQAPSTSMADPSLSNSFMSSATLSAVSGFNPMQQKVYNVILRNQHGIGIHKSEIVKKLEGQVGSRDVLSIVEFLCTEGHTYSTLDEEHYRCTDN